MSAVASLDEFLEKVAQRDGHQPEFLQAVREVFTSIWPFLEANPKYRSEALLERLVEPERAFQFRKACNICPDNIVDVCLTSDSAIFFTVCMNI